MEKSEYITLEEFLLVMSQNIIYKKKSELLRSDVSDFQDPPKEKLVKAIDSCVMNSDTNKSEENIYPKILEKQST